MHHLIGRFGSDGGGTNSKTRPAHIWPCTLPRYGFVYYKLASAAALTGSDLVCLLESFQANARHRLVLVLLSCVGVIGGSKPRFNQISCTACSVVSAKYSIIAHTYDAIPPTASPVIDSRRGAIIGHLLSCMCFVRIVMPYCASHG